MSKPRLCIDIDNVLAQTDRVMRKIIAEYTGKRVNLEYAHIIVFNYYECADAFGEKISRDEWQQVHALFSKPENILSVPHYPEVQNHLHHLSERFDLHLATARLPQARKTTVEWLEDHQFPPHSLHFLSYGEKHLSLGEFFASVEDDPKQANAFATRGFHSFLLAHPWNEVAPNSSLKRCSDWEEIAEELFRLADRDPLRVR